MSTLQPSFQLIASGEINLVPSRLRVRLRDLNVLRSILVLLHHRVVHVCAVSVPSKWSRQFSQDIVWCFEDIWKVVSNSAIKGLNFSLARACDRKSGGTPAARPKGAGRSHRCSCHYVTSDLGSRWLALGCFDSAFIGSSDNSKGSLISMRGDCRDIAGQGPRGYGILGVMSHWNGRTRRSVNRTVSVCRAARLYVPSLPAKPVADVAAFLLFFLSRHDHDTKPITYPNSFPSPTRGSSLAACKFIQGDMCALNTRQHVRTVATSSETCLNLQPSNHTLQRGIISPCLLRPLEQYLYLLCCQPCAFLPPDRHLDPPLSNSVSRTCLGLKMTVSDVPRHHIAFVD